MAVSGTGTTGYANNPLGVAGLTLTSFTSTANLARSAVSVNASALTVVHEFVASAAADLYKVNVTITGTAATTGNILYRRVIGWDVEPTAFNEYSTIQGNVAPPTYSTPVTTVSPRAPSATSSTRVLPITARCSTSRSIRWQRARLAPS